MIKTKDKHCNTCKCNETIKIPKLGIEITQPVKYTGAYNKIEVPKGWKLPTLIQLIIVCEDLEIAKMLNPYKDYVSIPCKQLAVDKKNERSRWFHLDWDLDLNSEWYGLGYSDNEGQVVFVRALK